MTFNFSLYYGNTYDDCEINSITGKPDFEFQDEITALGDFTFETAIAYAFKAIIEQRAKCKIIDNTFKITGFPAGTCIEQGLCMIYEFLTTDPREPYVITCITKIDD